ncbi:MAG TPA: gliding motility-associated C-terminal domain-containing protein [Flavobacteriales bacterium]
MLRVLVLLFFFKLFCPALLRGQFYQHVIGSPGRSERALVVHHSPSGALYIAGSINDSAMVQRIDDQGQAIWTVVFKPPGQYGKHVFDLTEDASGVLIGCGNGLTSGGVPFEGFHFSMGTDGTMNWVRHWQDALIYTRRIRPIDDGQYLLFCDRYDMSAPTYPDVFTARVDAASGDPLWISPRYDLNPSIPYIDDVVASCSIGTSHYSTGRIFVAGNPVSSCRIYWGKHAYTGELLEHRYLLYSSTQYSRIYPGDIIATNDSLLIAFSGDHNGATTNYKPGLVMTDTSGNVAWAKIYDFVGSAQELGIKVVSAPFGYVLSGRSTSSGMARCFLIGVSPTGDVLWAKQYGASNETHVAPHSYTLNLAALDDGFLMVAAVQKPGHTDMLLVRTDLQGNTCGDVNDITLQTTVLPTAHFLPGVQTGALSTSVSPVNTVMETTDVPPPCGLEPDLGPDTTLCGALTIGVVPQQGATYLWHDGSTLDHLVVEVPGTYWVEVTVGCCEVRDTIVVSAGGGGMDLNLGPDTLICDGEAILLSTGLADGDHYWQDVPGTMEMGISTAGTYWVEVWMDGCMARDTIVVDVVAPDAFDLGPDVQICPGGQASLVVPAEVEDPLWNDGSTDPTLTVDNGGTYWFTGLWNGCPVSDTAVVHATAPPVLDLGPDTMICPGASFILATGLNGIPHLWQDGSAAEVFEVVAPGIYWVQVGNICMAVDSVTVEMPELPEPDLGGDTLLCTGAQLVLGTATGAWDVEWSDGSTDGTFIIASPGTYWVEVRSQGCLLSDTVEVTGAEPPMIQLGTDTVLCNGTPMELIPMGAGVLSTLWSTGEQTPTVMATATGTYWVQVQNVCGTARDSVEIVIVPSIEVELGPDLLLCEPIAHLLESGHASEHSTWQDGVSGAELLVTGPGTYSVTVDIQGCTAADSISISMVRMPELEVSEDTLLCEAVPVLLQAWASDGVTVGWSDGSTGATHLAPNAGIHMVSATNVCGTVVDSIRVMHAPPFPYLTDQRVCPGASAFVSAPADVQQVQWSTGEASTSVALPLGAYDYLMVDASGCERTGSFTVLVDQEEDGRQFVPNVFTPNGDGRNDVFQVVGAEREGFSLEIYDRWGLLLFTASSGRTVWDGRANGGEVPEGVYIYVAKYQARCGERGLVTKLGHVTLLR